MARSEKRRAGTRLVPRAVREEQMLEVAGEVFAERGFHAASMDEIADRADISKPMLYAYFGSKDGLYSAYMQRTGAQLLATMDAAVDPELEPGPQVYASMAAFLGFVEEHREGWSVLQRELAAAAAARWPRTSAGYARRSSSAWRHCSRSTWGRPGPTCSRTGSSAPASRSPRGGSNTRS